MDNGTEEIGHVEIFSLISQLLDDSFPEDQSKAADNPIIGRVNPQQLIVSGLGEFPTNSYGVPWSGAYMVASGNLLVWATGSAQDGTGDFEFVAHPTAKGQAPDPKIPAVEVHTDLIMAHSYSASFYMSLP